MTPGYNVSRYTRSEDVTRSVIRHHDTEIEIAVDAPRATRAEQMYPHGVIIR